MTLNRFAKYAWATVLYTMFVILFGDVVQATGSGAGCGSHWPTCNGEVLPQLARLETVIEFTHRITSGLALVLVIGLLVWAFRAYPAGHRVRQGAGLSMFFMVLESLLGAGLVLFELVADNASTARVVVVSLHLVNTFLLLGAMTLTAWWASGGRAFEWRQRGWLGWSLWAGFIGLLLVGASGAVISLGDTLFPAATLGEGLQQKFDPAAHFAVRLRVYHPVIAIGVGAYLVFITNAGANLYPSRATRLSSRLVGGVYFLQLVVGSLNVVTLAALWSQLIHLFLSDLLLMALVIFMAAAFGQAAPVREPQELQPVAA